jgi:hypothetical protein
LTGELPVEVSVKGCVVGEPTVTPPKFRMAELSESCGATTAIPFPFKETTTVPSEELLLMVTCPLATPVTSGLNCTWSVIDCLGFNTTGRFPPETVKPAPLIVAEVMVTGEVPVDISVSGFVVDESTVTFPKFRLAVLSESCGAAAAIPLPLRDTTAASLSRESLLTVIFPFSTPVDVGLNCTWSVIDLPGLSTAGKPLPETAKSVPLIVAVVTVTGEFPVDVRVKGRVVGEPTVTPPKFRLAALIESWGAADMLPVPCNETVAAFPFDASLLIVSCPFAAPAAFGSN